MDPDKPIFLRDLQAAHQEGSMERTVINAILEENDLLDDIPFFQASNGDRDVTDVVTSLPTAHHYILGEGVPSSSGSQQQKSFAPMRSAVTMKILRERYEELAEKGREQAYVNNQMKLCTGALGQDLVTCMLMGSKKDDVRSINGLTALYNAFGGTKAYDTAKYVYDGFPTTGAAKGTAADVANLQSIFLVVWGALAIKPFFPEGAKNAGLNFGGAQMDSVSEGDPINGGTVMYYERKFAWRNGLAVVDPRKAARVCNVPVNRIKTIDSFGQELIENIELAMDMLPRLASGERPVFYMSRPMWNAIKTVLTRKTQSNAFTKKDLFDRPTDFLFDFPVRLNDAQDVAESLVSAEA